MRRIQPSGIPAAVARAYGWILVNTPRFYLFVECTAKLDKHLDSDSLKFA